VERYFGGRPGRGARYREDLQQEAVVLARMRILEGKSLALMASELGVGSETLSRWLGRAVIREPLRPVEVKGQQQESGEVCSLVLVTPTGWRIEGLRLEDVPELLRALG